MSTPFEVPVAVFGPPQSRTAARRTQDAAMPRAVGLSPGLDPTIFDVSNVPSAMGVPIPKCANIISEASTKARTYDKDEFLSVLGEHCFTPSSVLEWVAGLYSSDPHMRPPSHLRLLLDDLQTDRTALGGRKNRRVVRQVHHKVMSVLSRITPHKYDALRDELLELPLKQTTDKELSEIVNVFFEKAVHEAAFSEIYARLVSDVCLMTDAERQLDSATQQRLIQVRMRNGVLRACQDEFQRPLQLTLTDKLDAVTGRELSPEEIERKRDNLRKRLNGNIKFVGELFKHHLVTPKVIGGIFSVLLRDYDPANPCAKEDYVFEVFATLFKTVSTCLEDMSVVRDCVINAALICQTHPVNKVRFKMMDVCELNDTCKQFAAEAKARIAEAKAQIPPPAHMDPQVLQSAAVSPSKPTTKAPASALSTPVSKTAMTRQTTKGMSRVASASDSLSQRPSVPSSPMCVAGHDYTSREQTRRLIDDFDHNKHDTVFQRLKEMERGQVVATLTNWLHIVTTTTALFGPREKLPQLILGILERCEEPADMILSSSDLLQTVLEWLRMDVETKQFRECPRFFANWGHIVLSAFKQAGADIRNRPTWIRVLSVLSGGTLTLCLREIVTNEQREAIYTAIKDLLPIAANITIESDSLAGRDPHKVLNYAAITRFRLLPYVIKADESGRIRTPTTPNIMPIDKPADLYQQCFAVREDDAELQLFKRILKDPSVAQNPSDAVAKALDNIGQRSNVTRTVTTMKLTAATLCLLHPPQGESAHIKEADATNIVREIISRIPSDLQGVAQAAVTMEMISFFCCNTNKLLGLHESMFSASLTTSPGRPSRSNDAGLSIAATCDCFRRWCTAGVLDRNAVLSVLKSVAPNTVPSTPGTPPRASSASLDAMESSFLLPEPQTTTRPMVSAGSSGPATPQIHPRPLQYRFDQCEMLIRNVNFITSIKWNSIISRLERL